MVPPRKTKLLYDACIFILLMCVMESHEFGPGLPGFRGEKLLPKVCGRVGSSSRHSTGNEAPINTFTWMASLGSGDDSRTKRIEFLCAGTVINSRYVLTAAQCVSSRRPTEIHIGDWDLDQDNDCTKIGVPCSSSEIVAGVEKIIIHPGFKTRSLMSDDIALIRLNITIDINDGIEPICLPPSDFDIFGVGKSIPPSATGWEVYNANGQVSSTLKRLSVPFVDEERCRAIYTEHFDEKQLCAGGMGADSCLLSGSPLFLPTRTGNQMNLIGFASYGGVPCGTEQKPDVYTSVKDHRNWILSNLRP